MTAVQLSARDIMRAAYENRYTWDGNFPGYTTDVEFKHGEQTYVGTARVNPDLSAEVFDIEDEAALKMIKGQLWEVAIHRVRREFEDTHGKNTFGLGETDDRGAVEILVEGKSTGDKYKVLNDEVVLVHRHIHGVVVTINTFSTHDTGAGYLSHTYDSVYHDPKTGEQKKGRSEFTDEYDQVDGYFVLTRRAIASADEGDMEFRFSNIQLLTPEAA
ncbi:hypothetical protein N836_36545 [Leptolyngbya sp. Heron Island J]|uniref:DUF3386 domain-containing protein n=1 Tax=Leptolyngbya sp. Heron Island J TaxID=1385935 RepID=UPI0003B9B650|nr:DUF3386 domain-containing protein [Leptolyngbya sp. Heron Island J]ESA37533.1 hypothetical protein N836_36545 [Leptolyngbya sp. Heron Island J]